MPHRSSPIEPRCRPFALLGLLLALAVPASPPATAGATVGWSAKLSGWRSDTFDEAKAIRVLADGTALVLTRGEEWRAVRYSPSGQQLGIASWAGDPYARVAIDPFGGVALLDEVESATSPTGTWDLWVMKYDGLTGRRLWPAPALLDGPGDERALGLTFDRSGNVVVAAALGTHLLVLKLDGVTGSRAWPAPTDFSGSSWSHEAKTAVDTDAAGNVVVSNGNTAKFASADGALLWSAPSSVFGTFVAELAGMRLGPGGDVYLQAKGYFGTWKAATFALSGSTGTPLWPAPAVLEGAFSACHSLPRLIEVDGDGDVFVANYTQAQGCALDSRIAVQKYDGATGTPLWASPALLDGPANSLVDAVALATDGAGDLYVLSRRADNSPGSTTGNDMVTFKVRGADGGPAWAAPVVHASTPSRNDVPVGLGLDGAGNVFVVGTVQGVSLSPDSDTDVVTVKYDGATGAPLWPAPAVFDGGPTRRGTVVDVASDPAGNVFVTWGAGDYEEKDWVTVKVDGRTGRPLWPAAATYNGPFGLEDIPGAVAVDAAGDLYVAGLTRYLAANPYYWLALAKYDGATGARIWAIREEAPYPTEDLEPVHLALDPSGDPVVAWTRRELHPGTGTSVIGIMARKYSGASGAPAWAAPVRWVAADAPAYAMALATDAAGDVFVAGYADAFGVTPRWVALKLQGATGAAAWESLLPFPDVSSTLVKPTAMAVTSSGDVVLAGVGSDAAGKYPVTVVKYSGGTGAALWPAPYSYSNLPYRVDIALDPAGNIFLTHPTPADIQTQKLDGATGLPLWAAPAVYDGPDHFSDFPRACKVDAAGDVFVTGTSVGALGGSHFDIVTLKYDGTTGAPLWGGVRYDTGGTDRPEAIVLVDGDPVVVGNVDAYTPFAVRYTEELALEPLDDELGAARCGVAHTQPFAAVNGLPPYAFSVVSGSLPPGLSLVGDTLTGTPAGTGLWEFRVRVTDSAATPGVVERDYSLEVVSAAAILPILASANPVCPGGTVTLSVAGSWSSYLWLPGGETTPTVDVTVGASTTFGVVLTDATGCPVRGAVTVGVAPGLAPPAPVITAPSQVTAAASGLVASVVDHPGSTYSWTIVNGTITAGQGTSQIVFSAGASGTTTLSVVETKASGCPSLPATVALALVGPTRFFTVEPCRVLDTRGGADGPALGPGASRTVPVAGRCGVPAGARAVSANLTVAGPATAGFLAVHAADTARPLASALNFAAGQTRANNAILALSSDGAGEVSIFNGAGGSTHVLLDVSGYFE